MLLISLGAYQRSDCSRWAILGPSWSSGSGATGVAVVPYG